MGGQWGPHERCTRGPALRPDSHLCPIAPPPLTLPPHVLVCGSAAHRLCGSCGVLRGLTDLARYGVLLRPYFYHWFGGRNEAKKGMLRGHGGSLSRFDGPYAVGCLSSHAPAGVAAKDGGSAGECEARRGWENFFVWLDHGAGRGVDLDTAPRELLERAEVEFYTAAEAERFKVAFEPAPANGRDDKRCLLRCDTAPAPPVPAAPALPPAAASRVSVPGCSGAGPTTSSAAGRASLPPRHAATGSRARRRRWCATGELLHGGVMRAMSKSETTARQRDGQLMFVLALDGTFYVGPCATSPRLACLVTRSGMLSSGMLCSCSCAPQSSVWTPRRPRVSLHYFNTGCTPRHPPLSLPRPEDQGLHPPLLVRVRRAGVWRWSAVRGERAAVDDHPPLRPLQARRRRVRCGAAVPTEQGRAAGPRRPWQGPLALRRLLRGHWPPRACSGVQREVTSGASRTTADSWRTHGPICACKPGAAHARAHEPGPRGCASAPSRGRGVCVSAFASRRQWQWQLHTSSHPIGTWGL